MHELLIKHALDGRGSRSRGLHRRIIHVVKTNGRPSFELFTTPGLLRINNHIPYITSTPHNVMDSSSSLTFLWQAQTFLSPMHGTKNLYSS